jgi:hypothetical protein
MIARVRARYQGLLDHPIFRLEMRRIRRRRWWPGRRFFMFYPALLGAALGYGVVLALSDSPGVLLTALVTGVPAVCLLGVGTWLLAFALPWIAPALTAASIVRERELGTLDLLRATLLTERSIVLGKLGGCLAQSWPGLLTLALLTPFQLVWVGGSGLSSYLPALQTDPISVAEWPWVWLVVAGVAGWLGPWASLALHAAVGLFVSALARSSGVAIALSYAAIIVLRVSLRLVTSLIGVALTIWRPVTMAPAVTWRLATATGFSEAMPGQAMMVSTLTSLGTVLVEFAGAALLVWGAIWQLKRA